VSGRVVHLQVVPEHEAEPRRLGEVRASSTGLEGDVHAGREDGKRQVLLTHLGDLRDVGLEPGALREQVTVDLPGLMSLPSGTRLRAGEAVLEVTKACDPCTHIGEHLGAEDTEALRRRLEGRRGILARVAEPGTIRLGDPIEPC
jgi:MOSC domain-containing protein YiiM